MIFGSDRAVQILRDALALCEVSGTHEESGNSESGENGKNLSESHSGSRGSTYTMRDELLRINREHTHPATSGGNLVPVPAARSGCRPGRFRPPHPSTPRVRKHSVQPGGALAPEFHRAPCGQRPSR